jgi:hypothetical protein
VPLTLLVILYIICKENIATWLYLLQVFSGLRKDLDLVEEVASWL